MSDYDDAAAPRKTRRDPDFFVFSLPRSGSSWLSIFLSGKPAYCYHEPMADYPVDEWGLRVSQRNEAVVGAVDTGASCFGMADELRQTFPNMQRFALRRDPREVAASCAKFGVRFDAMAERAKLDALGADPIEYARLHDLKYLEGVWHRVIGTIFDAERARFMIEMRIERDVRLFFANRPSLGWNL